MSEQVKFPDEQRTFRGLQAIRKCLNRLEVLEREVNSTGQWQLTYKPTWEQLDERVQRVGLYMAKLREEIEIHLEYIQYGPK